LNLSFFIAKRYLISKKTNNAINVISWISIVAICITTASLVIVLSAMNGLTSIVANLYNAFEPDLKITSVNSKYMSFNDSIVKTIQNTNGIKTVSYCIEENALIKLDDQQALVTIKGVDENFKSLNRFDTIVSEGEYLLKHNINYFGIFGKGIANKLGINIRDYISPISIYAPKRGKVESLNPEDAFDKIMIHPSGSFSLNDDFDYKYVIVDIALAQQLFGCDNSFSTIEININNKKDLFEIQEKLKSKLGTSFSIKNRYELNDVLFKTLETEKLWTFIILAFILIIATFNIIGALTMLIIEKKDDIKTLYHLGATPQLIRSIFMKEGFLITAVGAFSGLLLGLLVCVVQIQFHLIKFDEQYIVSYYPVELQIKDFIWIISVVMSIGFLAAIYPVRVFTKNDIVH
jgi:lipoprotein-releasing system permease protein